MAFRLAGPMTVEKTVAYAGLILDALDAAHRKGFVSSRSETGECSRQ